MIADVEKGEHELRVAVDNTFGEHSALHIPNDYYTYGGITRPAAVEYIPDTYIKNIRFTPQLTCGRWSAETEVFVCNVSGREMEISVEVKLAGCCMEKTVTVGGGCEERLVFAMEFDEVQAWSNAQPALYFLQAVLSVNGEPMDDLIERVGFRTVTLDGSKIMVNGEAVYLKGFNRHEDYASVGCAIPLQLMAQDMDMMQEVGANALRTCHYPNDERFLDLCDERGILVWEENHARGLGLESMQNPNFDRQCEDCIREMIENHYNHPSIIIWGILNECASETEEGRKNMPGSMRR